MTAGSTDSTSAFCLLLALLLPPSAFPAVLSSQPSFLSRRSHIFSTMFAPFTRKLGKSKSARGAKSKQQRQEDAEQEREERLQEEHQLRRQLSQQQQQQRRQLPLRYRLLPLVVSGAALQGLSFFFGASTPRGDRVLFALLCFLGAAVAIEACRSAIAFGGVQQRRQRQSPAAAAVNHFRSNASRYMASFLVVVILQAVWSETQHREDERQQQQRHQRQEDARLPYHSALSSLAVLAIAVALQLVAPRLGGCLFRELGDVRPPRLVLLRDSAPPCGPRWAWKTVKGCFVTSVVLGLCIAAAVLSGGGGVLVGLGMTHSVVSAGREALPVIRKGWLRRKMSRSKGAAPAAPANPAGAAGAADAAAPPLPPPSAPSFSLERVIASVRAGPTRVICSPVVLPAFLLWVTHSTICSWPKECTDRLALLFRVVATTICVMHLVRAPAEAESEASTHTGDGGDDGSGEGNVGGGDGGDGTAWPYKVFVGACSLAAWGFLLLTSLIVLDRQKEDSPEGLVVMLLVATAVALRTPHERSWRGLMLVFWAALLAVLVNAAASKLMQQNEVFYRIFYDDSGRGVGNGGPVLPFYLGVFRAVAQLRRQGRVALWTVCPSRESSLGGSAHHARESWFGSWWF